MTENDLIVIVESVCTVSSESSAKIGSVDVNALYTELDWTCKSTAPRSEPQKKS